MAAVSAAHWDRLRAIDGLLAEPPPLPVPAPGAEDTLLAVNGGVGLARRTQRDPDELAATWGALDQRWLFGRVTGPAAMTELLARWRGHITGAGPDSAAVLPWPSRDVAMTKMFLAHGLYPESVIAIRSARQLDRAAPDGVRIRRATTADLPDIVALYMTLTRFGELVSGITERPSTARLVRETYTAELAADPPWVWVADRAGELVGLASVAVGERARWIASQVAATPVAYVDCMSVAASHRGAGVGSALIGHLHAALDEAGTAATLLHYSGLNPLSAPFWHRCGYRPLSTRWQLSPAR